MSEAVNRNSQSAAAKAVGFAVRHSGSEDGTGSKQGNVRLLPDLQLRGGSGNRTRIARSAVRRSAH